MKKGWTVLKRDEIFINYFEFPLKFWWRHRLFKVHFEVLLNVFGEFTVLRSDVMSHRNFKNRFSTFCDPFRPFSLRAFFFSGKNIVVLKRSWMQSNAVIEKIESGICLLVKLEILWQPYLWLIWFLWCDCCVNIICIRSIILFPTISWNKGYIPCLKSLQWEVHTIMSLRIEFHNLNLRLPSDHFVQTPHGA